MRTALISIKPEFAELILDGTKRYEFRRRAPRHRGPIRFVIYASSPVRRLAGEMVVSEIVEGNPAYVWAMTGEEGGISEDRFKQYFSGKIKAHALRVASFRRYENGLALNQIRQRVHEHFSPPQFMTWLSDERYQILAQGQSQPDSWVGKSIRYVATQARQVMAKTIASFAPAAEG